MRIALGLAAQPAQQLHRVPVETHDHVAALEVIGIQAANLARADPREDAALLGAFECPAFLQHVQRAVRAVGLPRTLELARECLFVIFAEGRLDVEPAGGDVAEEPAARVGAVGEPETETLEVSLDEDTAIVMVLVYAKNFGSRHFLKFGEIETGKIFGCSAKAM
ncbi:hypothetical protein ACMFMG_004920 [Clarireedia jacksonii]